MELNLRKARKLENSIHKYLEATNLEYAAKIRTQENMDVSLECLREFRKKMLSDAHNRFQLIKIRHDLRVAIAKENERVGINELLHKKAYIDSQIKETQKHLSFPISEEDQIKDVIEFKRKSFERGESGRYGNHEDVLFIDVSGIDEETRKKDLSEMRSLKRSLEQIEEDLVQKNIGAKVTLDAYTEELLKSAGLL